MLAERAPETIFEVVFLVYRRFLSLDFTRGSSGLRKRAGRSISLRSSATAQQAIAPIVARKYTKQSLAQLR